MLTRQPPQTTVVQRHRGPSLATDRLAPQTTQAILLDSPGEIYRYRDFRANFTVTLCCEVNSGRKWEFQYQREIANGTYFHSCTRARERACSAPAANGPDPRTQLTIIVQLYTSIYVLYSTTTVLYVYFVPYVQYTVPVLSYYTNRVRPCHPICRLALLPVIFFVQL